MDRVLEKLERENIEIDRYRKLADRISDSDRAYLDIIIITSPFRFLERFFDIAEKISDLSLFVRFMVWVSDFSVSSVPIWWRVLDLPVSFIEELSRFFGSDFNKARILGEFLNRNHFVLHLNEGEFRKIISVLSMLEKYGLNLTIGFNDIVWLLERVVVFKGISLEDLKDILIEIALEKGRMSIFDILEEVKRF